MTDEAPITLERAVQQVVEALDGPTPVTEVACRVLAIWPSAAKKPEQQVRNYLSGHREKTWLYLEAKTVIPLRMVMSGARFRIVLSRLECRRGLLFFEPNFHGFVKPNLAAADLTLLDAAGQPLLVQPTTVKLEHKSPFGNYTTENEAWGVNAWFKDLKARDGDSLLATVEDWDAGRYRLEHEPVGKRRFDEVDRKNHELADLLFRALEESPSESVHVSEALARSYERMAEPGGYPGDPWMLVVERDARMKLFGNDIRYAESRSWFENVMGRKKGKPAPVAYVPAQSNQVYRFKAAFKYRPGLWRRVEIQGHQTLAELDDCLRDAFGHDFSDHMSGFWRKVRRGDTKRLREVELATIAPFGGKSENADTRLAAVGLAVGDEVKYVYDFGDWVEHTLKLEAIAEPEAGVKYPRVAAQNKPQYQDCERCAALGRKTRATWVCHDCSSEQGRMVVLCEDCLLAEHEEHYADEIVY